MTEITKGLSAGPSEEQPLKEARKLDQPLTRRDFLKAVLAGLGFLVGKQVIGGSFIAKALIEGAGGDFEEIKGRLLDKDVSPRGMVLTREIDEKSGGLLWNDQVGRAFGLLRVYSRRGETQLGMVDSESKLLTEIQYRNEPIVVKIKEKDPLDRRVTAFDLRLRTGETVEFQSFSESYTGEDGKKKKYIQFLYPEDDPSFLPINTRNRWASDCADTNLHLFAHRLGNVLRGFSDLTGQTKASIIVGVARDKDNRVLQFNSVMSTITVDGSQGVFLESDGRYYHSSIVNDANVEWKARHPLLIDKLSPVQDTVSGPC